MASLYWISPLLTITCKCDADIQSHAYGHIDSNTTKRTWIMIPYKRFTDRLGDKKMCTSMVAIQSGWTGSCNSGMLLGCLTISLFHLASFTWFPGGMYNSAVTHEIVLFSVWVGDLLPVHRPKHTLCKYCTELIKYALLTVAIRLSRDIATSTIRLSSWAILGYMVWLFFLALRVAKRTCIYNWDVWHLRIYGLDKKCTYISPC